MAETKQTQKPTIKFGTDGWRGIIADDFTGEHVRLVSQAVVEYFEEPETSGEKTVVIGYDNRSQSEYFGLEAAKIVAANGLRPVLTAQSCSSPSVSFTVDRLKAKGGIMITASHNPPAFNGLKIKANFGGSASPEIVGHVEKRLSRLLDANAQPKAGADDAAKIEKLDLRPDYFQKLISLIDLERIRQAGFKIVIDPMYGSGSGYLSSILQGAGVEDVVEIRAERNPFFGGVNPEPITENMHALFDAVLTHRADVGIAVDGDADRVGACDSLGRFVDCHRIFSVLLKHLYEQRHWTGAVVKTVSVTQMIDKLCAKYGLTLYETPIGFKYICDLMLQEDILIGGEESGGIGVKNYIPERDGVLMGLFILEAMSYRGMRLEALIDEIIAEVGIHEYGRIDMHPDPAKMANIVAHLKEYEPNDLAGQPVASVSRKDGTKLLFEDSSWLLLRPSGTEPVVRVYAESSSQERVKALLDAGTGVVNGV